MSLIKTNTTTTINTESSFVPFANVSIGESKTTTPFATYNNNGIITLNSKNTQANYSIINEHYNTNFSLQWSKNSGCIIFAEDETDYYMLNLMDREARNYTFVLQKLSKSTKTESMVKMKNNLLESNLEDKEQLLFTMNTDVDVTVNNVEKWVNRFTMYRKKITDTKFRQCCVIDLDTNTVGTIGFYSFDVISNKKLKGLYVDKSIPRYPQYEDYKLCPTNDFKLLNSEKKWLALGDSLTDYAESSYIDQMHATSDVGTNNASYGVNYIHFVESMSNLKAVTRSDGRSFGFSARTIGSGNIADTLYNNKSYWESVDCDIVTLFAGTNDYYYAIPLGTIDDYKNDTGLNTFYGALRKYITAFKELNTKPDIEIVLITPIQRFTDGYDINIKNGIGLYLSDYVEAIKDVGEYESIKVIDLYHNGGIGTHNYNEVLRDKLHPNKLGYEILARHIVKALGV